MPLSIASLAFAGLNKDGCLQILEECRFLHAQTDLVTLCFIPVGLMNKNWKGSCERAESPAPKKYLSVSKIDAPNPGPSYDLAMANRFRFETRSSIRKELALFQP